MALYLCPEGGGSGGKHAWGWGLGWGGKGWGRSSFLFHYPFGEGWTPDADRLAWPSLRPCGHALRGFVYECPGLRRMGRRFCLASLRQVCKGERLGAWGFCRSRSSVTCMWRHKIRDKQCMGPQPLAAQPSRWQGWGMACAVDKVQWLRAGEAGCTTGSPCFSLLCKTVRAGCMHWNPSAPCGHADRNPSSYRVGPVAVVCMCAQWHADQRRLPFPSLPQAEYSAHAGAHQALLLWTAL